MDLLGVEHEHLERVPGIAVQLVVDLATLRRRVGAFNIRAPSPDEDQFWEIHWFSLTKPHLHTVDGSTFLKVVRLALLATDPPPPPKPKKGQIELL